MWHLNAPQRPQRFIRCTTYEHRIVDSLKRLSDSQIARKQANVDLCWARLSFGLGCGVGECGAASWQAGFSLKLTPIQHILKTTGL